MAAEMIIDWINIMKKNRAPAARDEETNSHTPRYCIDNEESHFPLLKFLKKSYFLYLSPHLDFKKILERNFDQNPTPLKMGWGLGVGVLKCSDRWCGGLNKVYVKKIEIKIN